MVKRPKLPAKLRKEIEKELKVGESIKWIEQPIPRFFNFQSSASFFTGVPLIAFSIFWIYGTLGFKLPDLTKGISFQNFLAHFENLSFLEGEILFFVGLWMLSSPLREWLKAFRTVYLITDRRAFSVEGGWIPVIRNYFPNQLRNLRRNDRRDGTGDVVITTRLHKNSRVGSWTEDIGFMNLRNPKEVERLLRQLTQTKLLVGTPQRSPLLLPPRAMKGAAWVLTQQGVDKLA